MAPGTSLPAGVRILQASAGTPTTVGGQRVVFLSSAGGTIPTATIITKPAQTQPTTSTTDAKAAAPKNIPQVDGADDEAEPDPSQTVQEKSPITKTAKSTLESALLGQGSGNPSATSGMSSIRC